MGRWSRLQAPLFVAFAGIHDGAAVLDVGSGTGVLSLAIRAVNPSGLISGIDVSAGFVAHATTQHADARIDFRIGDAQHLDFPDASFDAALSMLVLNFVPDPVLAVREMKRVTRPGGTVAATQWDLGGDMEMLRIFADEASAFDPEFANDERGAPLGKPGALAALFRTAGLERVEDTALDLTLHFTSFDDYWKPFLLGIGPAGAHVARLSPERREALASRLRQRLGDHAFDLKGRGWAVKATVP
ncbi:MAG TPA: methyltransferase domain-containing protein [Kofleriaceae bacterium]|nr:methyltransferase domain-containing protein [Kofleriaceae bacterium]